MNMVVVCDENGDLKKVPTASTLIELGKVWDVWKPQHLGVRQAAPYSSGIKEEVRESWFDSCSILTKAMCGKGTPR